MSSSQLIEIADKVFWNRDTEIEKKYRKRYKEEQKRTDQRFAMLATALGKSSSGPPEKPLPAPGTVKRLPAMRETRVQSPGWEDPLEKEMTTHSSTLA